ncbi:hypothetical protein CFter6_1951 [Collimonas fungivorans]|uniref:Uncharacterized protein n=1 Tax=Collimonas fungivorans TaxID=158899 RepID=A0A127PAI3_9BURK|nr:hypothetical protein CFter6_1951 [Collimonas fungivorans]
MAAARVCLMNNTRFNPCNCVAIDLQAMPVPDYTRSFSP